MMYVKMQNVVNYLELVAARYSRVVTRVAVLRMRRCACLVFTQTAKTKLGIGSTPTLMRTASAPYAILVPSVKNLASNLGANMCST